MTSAPLDFNKLVPLALGGDSNAMAAVVRDLDRLIKSVLHRADVPQRDADDVAQECRLTLVTEVLPSWEPARGPLPRLAKAAFRNVVAYYREAMSAAKRGGGKRHMSIADDLPTQDVNPAEQAAAQDARDALMANILQHASPTMKRIVPLLIEGYTYTEIEQLLGIGAGSAKVQVYKLRNQLGIEPKARNIEQIDAAGQVVASHPSLKDAANALNLSAPTIGAALRGKQKTAGGFRWRYKPAA